VSLGIVHTPLLPPEADLNLDPGSYDSDDQGSHVGSQAFLGSLVQLELIPLACQDRSSLPSDQQGLVAPGRGGYPDRLETLSWR
jgi:hypothetical protein